MRWLPQLKLARGGPRLIEATRAAVQVAWTAARWPFTAAIVLELVGALSLGALLLAGRELVERLTADVGTQQLGDIVAPTVVLAVAMSVSGLARVVVRRFRFVASEHVSRHIARQIIDVTTSVDYEAYETQRFNDLLDRARKNASDNAYQLIFDILGIVNVLFATGVVLAVLVGTIPQLLPVVLLIAGPAVLAARASARLAFQAHMELTPDDRLLSYLYHAQTGINHGRELRIFGLAGALRERWAQLYDHKIRRLIQVADKQAWYGGLASAFGAVAVTAVLLIVAGAALRGGISLGDAAVAIVALQQLNGRVAGAANAAGSLRQATFFLDDFARFRSYLPQEEDGAAAAQPAAPLPPGAIEVEDVRFHYPGTDRLVLDGVSLRIEPGEIVALVGLSGSGKTTLAHLTAGLYRPSAGRITFGGVDLRELDRATYWRSLTVVFQDYVRYELTARENVAMSDRSRAHDLDAVREAARRAGIVDALDGLPSGLETMMSRAYEDGGELSVGQWQRLALARAFFRDAPILILDEPAAALDAVEEQRLFERLVDLAADRTVLLISHRFSTVRMAHRIAVMDGGRLTEQGTHEELMAMDGRYAGLFNLQARGYLPDGAVPGDLGDRGLHGQP